MYRIPPFGSGRLKRKSVNGCLAFNAALCLSQLPPSPTGTAPRSQRYVPRKFFVSIPCPRLPPVTRGKRHFSSCSQYHSEVSSVRTWKRPSHTRNFSSSSSGFFGFFLASMYSRVPLGRYLARLQKYARLALGRASIQALACPRSPNTSALPARRARTYC